MKELKMLFSYQLTMLRRILAYLLCLAVSIPMLIFGTGMMLCNKLLDLAIWLEG